MKRGHWMCATSTIRVHQAAYRKRYPRGREHADRVDRHRLTEAGDDDHVRAASPPRADLKLIQEQNIRWPASSRLPEELCPVHTSAQAIAHVQSSKRSTWTCFSHQNGYIMQPLRGRPVWGRADPSSGPRNSCTTFLLQTDSHKALS